MLTRPTFTETSSDVPIGDLIEAVDRLGAIAPDTETYSWPGSVAVKRRIAALVAAFNRRDDVRRARQEAGPC